MRNHEFDYLELKYLSTIYYHRTSKGGESIDKDSLSKMGVKKWKRKQKDKDSSRGTSPSQSMATTVATSGILIILDQ